MRYTLYSDGASRGNPGESGAGALIVDQEGDPTPLKAYLGQMTNNQAEYRAVILGLEKLVKLGAKDVEIRADSELLVKQLNGLYRVKNEGLMNLFFRAKELLGHFDRVKIVHVRREQNKDADRLANEAIDEQISGHL